MEFAKLLSVKNNDRFGAKPVTAAFLGDSVTQGCFEVFRIGENEIDTIHDYENVYHTALRKMLNNIFPDAPINIINAGIGGGNAANGLERLERDVLNFSPDIAVVCFGLNDVHMGLNNVNVYEEALRGIFQRLRKENVETIFMTPNMMNTNVSPHIKDDFIKSIADNFAKLQNGGVMDAYMNSARAICEQESVPVCDCYEKWKALYKSGVNITELLSNHLNHPSRYMHSVFAQALFDLIMFG